MAALLPAAGERRIGVAGDSGVLNPLVLREFPSASIESSVNPPPGVKHTCLPPSCAELQGSGVPQ